ncbi:MAG: peptidyl-prolyl cis-trans isomerase [Gammaproteobacteria bacterium]|nr:peptidyl-prolyl cis-trans isomerase [Gammaproteobacteria bacterium]
MPAGNLARRLAREPLVHFALLGAVLFIAYEQLDPAWSGGAAAEEIVVTAGRVRSLAGTFARTWQRPPTPAELDGLVEDYIREEVLYREALALGLDRDDTVVRRRLRQKLEFLSEDMAAAEPTAEELAAFFAENATAYQREAELTFAQVFLDPSKRGDRLEADAARLLETLRNRTNASETAVIGDSLMLEGRYEQVTATDVARLFGAAFEIALRDQPLGQWSGPLRSGYGAHLVLVETRTPGQTPGLAEVRDMVARDWSEARRQRMLDEHYQSLRERFRIRIEALPPAEAAPGP